MKQGGMKKCVDYGRRLLWGIRIEKNVKVGYDILKRGSEYGDGDSLVEIGKCHEMGIVVKKDLYKTGLFYLAGLLKGGSVAIDKLKGYALNNEMIVECMRWLYEDVTFKAERGDDVCQNVMGGLYLIGLYVPQDHSEAARWYHLSAEQGNSNSQNNLAFFYEEGIGVEKDLSKAIRLYRLSAEQGNATGQNNLGYCFQHGTGVEVDLSEAVRLYRLSAEQGYATAQNNLGGCYRDGSGVEKSMCEAFKWYRLSAEQGNAATQYNLGVYYEEGTGVEKNLSEAIKWYKLAAEQGLDEAKEALEILGKQ